MAVDQKLDYFSDGTKGLLLEYEDCKKLGSILEPIVVDIYRRCGLDKEDYMRSKPFKVFGRILFHYKVLDTASYLSDLINDYVSGEWVGKEPIPYLRHDVLELISLDHQIRTLPYKPKIITREWLIKEVQRLLGE